MTETTEKSFINEMLEEVEAAEQAQQDVALDLTLAEIRDITTQIERIFETSDSEKRVVDEWALKRTSNLQSRIDFLSKKMESLMAARGVKTIDLANGILKIRKKPDRMEVDDMEAFLIHASRDLVTVVPEEVRADLRKVREYIKRTGGRPPKGVRIIEGKEEFSYKLKGTTNGKSESKAGA